VKVLQETQLSISDAILKQQSVEDYLQKLLRIDARNYTNAAAFVARNRHFFETPSRTALSKKRPSLNIERRSGGTESVSMELLGEIVPLLSKIGEQDWTANNIRNVVNDQLIMHDRATNFGVKAWSRFVHGYIRWALSAGQPGPDGADTMEILGREETLARLSAAAEIITSTPEEKTA
jgi:glutamyl-tRNA synthetase